jgi:vacuolar-type H+-ATPase subunit H
MEARARAAVARLQELNEGGAAAPAASLDAEEAETISRTLLLAQRTADSTVAEARAEAARLIADAKDEAAKTLDSTRVMSARLIDEAREEARRVGDVERSNVAGEVEALKARREFLESDVHHLEVFLVDQRARVREAANALLDVVERVPGGLGEVRAPLLSASDDDDGVDAPSDTDAGGPPVEEDLLIVTELATDDVSDDAASEGDDVGRSDDTGRSDDAAAPTLDDQPWAGDETEAMPTVDAGGEDQSTDDVGSEFRFSFDDERN